MNQNLFALTTLTMLLFATAKSVGYHATETRFPHDRHIENVTRPSYSSQEKEAYSRKIETRLLNWERRISELKEEVRNARHPGRQQRLDGILKITQDKLTAIHGEYSNLKIASEARWHHIRDRMELEFGDLKNSYDARLAE